MDTGDNGRSTISGLFFINSKTGAESELADAAGLLHLPEFFFFYMYKILYFFLTQLCSTVFILANESLPTHTRASKTPTDQRQGKEMPELFAEIWQQAIFCEGPEEHSVLQRA